MASDHHHTALHLSDLLTDIGYTDPAIDPEIGGLTLDSRQVAPGGLFLACRGSSGHGLDHVQQAVKRRAAAVVCEPGAEWNMERIAKLRSKLPIPLVVVPHLRPHVGRIAARFYG
ncbi:MAG TPA: UDP-N-acetylmuramoylalanyl-D-glutamate--2,6-diaminopimelate ligase, partial [Chromatiales bacterium]|nr:UDP-N-acetylmuramoylalanyl-D-glutamate--2,6-diaminopimelate ligase [Chromatiales bacterium]